jgi:hypothetical protein
MPDRYSPFRPITGFSAASPGDRSARIAYAEALRRSGGSDLARWARVERHDPNWSQRGEELAHFARPGERVFEFGAGLSKVWRALPAGCQYTASDLSPLANSVAPYDLNAPLLEPIVGQDVALLSGVLEYVHDLSRAAGFLAANFNSVLCSYAASGDGSPDEIDRRRYSGWFTDFKEDDFRALFTAADFTVTQRSMWRGQTLFRFDRPSYH